MQLNIDVNLIFVGIAIISILILGVVILINNHRSITNQAFFLLSITTIFWSACNYLVYNSVYSSSIIFLLRLGTFFAVWNAFSIFLLLFVFPQEKIIFPKWITVGLVPFVSLTSILTLTALVFSHVVSFTADGHINEVANNPGILAFAITVLGSIVTGFVTFYKKMHRARGEEKKRFRFIFIGSLITFSFILLFNFIFPAVLQIPALGKFGALYTLPFIAFTAYAIVKYKLFSVKVVATELITFALWIFILIRTLLASSIQETIINGGLFVVTVVVGILLIRSVFKEVSQRERLEKLTLELEDANEKLKGLDKLKTEFLSLASHQLRSPITAIKGYTSMLLDGSFGKIAKTQTEAISRVFQSSQNLAKVVEDLLDVAKIEQGGMKYQLQETDLEKICGEVFNEMSIAAKNKGITLTYENTGAVPCLVSADPTKIRQVVLNLLDNSVKYTTQGFSKLTLKKTDKDAIIQITDSGIGMSKETKEKLFGKFNRGEGQKVNAGGSGLGLYLVKQIVEAHQGKIDADSEGENKGSIFTATIPLVQK